MCCLSLNFIAPLGVWVLIGLQTTSNGKWTFLCPHSDYIYIQYKYVEENHFVERTDTLWCVAPSPLMQESPPIVDGTTSLCTDIQIWHKLIHRRATQSLINAAIRSSSMRFAIEFSLSKKWKKYVFGLHAMIFEWKTLKQPHLKGQSGSKVMTDLYNIQIGLC